MQILLIVIVIAELSSILYLLDRLVSPKRLSHSAAVKFTGANMPQIDNLVLNVGQTSTLSPITFLADGITPSGATYSNTAVTFSDASGIVVLNADGVTALVTGVAASTGPVSGTGSFTATDTDGAVSQWTQGFTVTVNAVTPPPPEQLSQSAAVSFSDPV